MSLVAYGASSDEDSEYEEEDANTIKVELLQPTKKPLNNSTHKSEFPDFSSNQSPTHSEIPNGQKKSIGLCLPKPKNANPIVQNENADDDPATPAFLKLPTPKQVKTKQITIEEEDDEFLHKKEIPSETPESSKIKKPKGPVKISIPSLKEFKDVDRDLANKAKNPAKPKAPRGCSLLNLLPTAKSEQNFAKTPAKPIIEPEPILARESPEKLKRPTVAKATTSLIPDTVRTRRPAANTEGVDGINIPTKKTVNTKNSGKSKVALVNCSDSEASEDEDAALAGDFFSLNTKEKLPEVSNNEINAMVAKRAAKIAETTTKYLSTSAELEAREYEEMQQEHGEKRLHESQLDEKTIQALEGSSAKRRRKQQGGINIIDISSEQVLPSREEWMRSALTSATTYQPTGVLNDDEPAAGTRKKHQITYLAHKAKANEAELQAMWSANRHTRQQTQNKYGF